MNVANVPALERVARVLAARHLSPNAGGESNDVADDVDDTWANYLPDAIAVVKSLREPDGAMAMVGDEVVWKKMIAAALTDQV